MKHKPIEEMLKEIEFKEFGKYQIFQDKDPMEQTQYASNSICSSYSFLEQHYLLIEDGIANAVLWGNNSDPFVMASAKVLLGKKGWVLRIRDSGEGFNVDEVLKNGTYQYAGCGLRQLKAKQKAGLIEFSYENNGNTLNIMGFYKK